VTLLPVALVGLLLLMGSQGPAQGLQAHCLTSRQQVVADRQTCHLSEAVSPKVVVQLDYKARSPGTSVVALAG
jgi:hypothetical protein